jgi:hypothetical protein
MRAAWVVAALLLAGCPEKPKAAAAPPPKPVPLEPLIAERGGLIDAGDEREALFTVKPFTFAGEPAPEGARRLEIAGLAWKLGGEAVTAESLKAKLGEDGKVVLSFDEETYLAQVQPLFALLDDTKAKVWLQSPDAPALAWPVRLRDETSFAAWVDETVPGKLRIVQRADGFELQTNMGKLSGGDPKGPTVPVRGGKLDLVTLQKGLDLVKKRFKDAPDVCFLPSFATTLRDATRAVASNWLSAEQVVFAEACFVYPRPVPPKQP